MDLNRKPILCCGLLVGLFLLPLPRLFADTDPTTGHKTPSLIETHMDLGFFGLLGGSMEYSLDGKRLESYREFKDLIYPLRDQQASDMIREAEDKNFVAWMFYVGGVATGADLALAYPPVPFLRVDWIDRIASGVVAAEVVVGIGLIFDNSAEGEKYNAVQRYNHLIHGKDKETWQFTPQLYASGGHLDLGVRTGF